MAAPPTGPRPSLTPRINPTIVLHRTMATSPISVAFCDVMLCDCPEYRAK
ncbi:hypothetical protein SPAB_01725 [Salmonella enterica subsp. enterica serovar Paratyphi B str. SPB7]|uniref:Uncharacterized protein n=1 Tax=Salmonella paratyphi B (strain ATCC BAA-1250 / SPB7) TaxID=1016998 RepID=A0A6C6Z1K4_SALPB|nr:hypothetical protein SPAB_01725 [Salmonella enterica subsp. enterica serovar Paratyphi B str. SPB7]